MQNKIGCHSGDTGAMRNSVEWATQFGMLFGECSDVLDLFPGTCKRFLELRLSLHFRFSQSHLDTAVGIYLPLAGCFDREENHVLKSAGNGGLNSIGLGGGKAA